MLILLFKGKPSVNPKRKTTDINDPNSKDNKIACLGYSESIQL